MILTFQIDPKLLFQKAPYLVVKGCYFPSMELSCVICANCVVCIFSASQKLSFMFVRREEIKEFIGSMKEAGKGRELMNISDEVSLLIEKITCRTLFGTEIKERERVNFKPLVQEGLRLIGSFNINDYLPFMKVFDFQGMTNRAKDVTKLMDKHLDRIIDEHEQEASAHQEHHKDLVTVLVLDEILLCKWEKPRSNCDQGCHLGLDWRHLGDISYDYRVGLKRSPKAPTSTETNSRRVRKCSWDGSYGRRERSCKVTILRHGTEGIHEAPSIYTFDPS